MITDSFKSYSAPGEQGVWRVSLYQDDRQFWEQLCSKRNQQLRELLNSFANKNKGIAIELGWGDTMLEGDV